LYFIKVPSALDAVVIGSGIGGLTTAVILAKSGKKEFYLQLLKSFFFNDY